MSLSLVLPFTSSSSLLHAIIPPKERETRIMCYSTDFACGCCLSNFPASPPLRILFVLLQSKRDVLSLFVVSRCVSSALSTSLPVRNSNATTVAAVTVHVFMPDINTSYCCCRLLTLTEYIQKIQRKYRHSKIYKEGGPPFGSLVVVCVSDDFVCVEVSH